MKIIIVIVGGILSLLGVFCIANGGLSFISMAFPIGIVLIIVGLFECLAYKRSDEDEESRHWILTEGITTFFLGVVVLTGQLAADIAVPVVFGMWTMVSGIRGGVIVTRNTDKEARHGHFYWMVVVSILNFVVGLYTFFNSMLLQLSVLILLGVIFVVEGANVIKIGMEIPYRKPELIKTKEEKVADAEERAAKANVEARKAIKKAKKAIHAVKKAENSKEFEEIINEPIGEENQTTGESR